MKEKKSSADEMKDIEREIIMIHLPLLKETVNWKRIIIIQEKYPHDRFFPKSMEHNLDNLILTGGQMILGFDFTIELKLSYLTQKDGRQLPYHRKKHRFTILSHNALRVCGSRNPCPIDIESTNAESEEYKLVKKVFDTLWTKGELVNTAEIAGPTKAARNYLSMLRQHHAKK